VCSVYYKPVAQNYVVSLGVTVTLGRSCFVSWSFSLAENERIRELAARILQNLGEMNFEATIFTLAAKFETILTVIAH